MNAACIPCRPLFSWLTPFCVVLLLLSAGCSEDVDHTAAPEGWTTSGPYWWTAGADTAQAFRNMETLKAMGILDLEQTVITGSMQNISKEQFTNAVKRSLIALYRNRPEIVDSLFAEYALDDVQGATLGTDVRQTVNEYRDQSYDAINKRFRVPRTKLTLGEDIPVPFPDSLRRPETSGRVQMQVYLNASGEPQAVEVVQGVHPTLDRIALRAATQMQWEPAYIRRERDWEAIPSWDRISINFRPPSQG